MPVEIWLRGPIDGVPPLLQPVAHALLQAAEDATRILGSLSDDEIWARPGSSASIGFHALHLAGATDRLLTYARGEALTETQREAAAAEPHTVGVPSGAIVERVQRALAQALAQLRATSPATLTEARQVGRARLPSTVIGLLGHAAEHASRHAGQMATLARVVRGV